MLIQSSRLLNFVDCTDDAAEAADASSFVSPAQEVDACISAFSHLQIASERIVLMCSELTSQSKEDTAKILRMDEQIKSGRVVVEGLREDIRNSVPRKPHTEMFTQTITVTCNAASQTEAAAEDAASRRATPPISASNPPTDMETLSQFLSK